MERAFMTICQMEAKGRSSYFRSLNKVCIDIIPMGGFFIEL